MSITHDSLHIIMLRKRILIYISIYLFVYVWVFTIGIQALYQLLTVMAVLYNNRILILITMNRRTINNENFRRRTEYFTQAPKRKKNNGNNRFVDFRMLSKYIWKLAYNSNIVKYRFG